MRIMIVDDEDIALERMSAAVKRVEPDAEIVSFHDPYKALKYARSASPEVVFLEIVLPVMNGIKLAENLKEDNPYINVIFTTDHSEYMRDAFEMHASGYLMKPVSDEMVRHELSDLRNPPETVEKAVQIFTFGKFEVFVKEDPVEFQYSKSEELFAVLVDYRGKAVGTDRIKKLLWQEDVSVTNHASYISILKKDMINAFSKLGVDNIFRREGAGISLITGAVRCDYYDYIDNKEGGAPFMGRYMEKYAWAEPTVAILESIRRKRERVMIPEDHHP